jgi:hypothetical protein
VAEPVDLVDAGNCQTDMQTGMLAGDARLPPKLAKQAEQQERGQFAQALADALRKPKLEESK